eukprot:gnl/MRDRNA2_/MRDRNA2_54612_c0_seq1.p1 gnl/MRDRNA2_/MRDRNA2_54612_c0~~gnl/MRDRNA2_/MRDRNA2_54612_c0_seq1.p1  ORF type:complete len:181 (+),score=48.82 gnl/MRDRNA2_/MRDRNA2_54612_c0_seq1:107-649(+)
MGTGASTGIKAAIAKSSDADLKAVLDKLPADEKAKLVAALAGESPPAEAPKEVLAMAEPQKDHGSRIKFAVVDAIETKCLEGIDQQTFVQKLTEKLSDPNLSFGSPGSFKPAGPEPYLAVDIDLSYAKVPQEGARAIMEAHIENVLHTIRDWWPEIDQVDTKVTHLLNTDLNAKDEDFDF